MIPWLFADLDTIIDSYSEAKVEFYTDPDGRVIR